MIVGTCDSAASPGGPVLGIIDTQPSVLSVAPVNIPSASYAWRMSHNETGIQSGTPSPAREWRNTNLGEVFGLAIDDDPAAPNIYTTATTVYGQGRIWPAGSTAGSVYKLDGTTGAITRLVNLPTTGTGTTGTQASLGNVCFHRSANNSRWLFVSNLDNGLIYRIDPASGTIASTYDHGVAGRASAGVTPAIPDVTTSVFTQSGRRIWGLEDYNSRLYYGVWHNDSHLNEVWSVELDATGAPVTTAGKVKLEVTVPAIQVNQKAPISDLSFAGNGRMYVAERYHTGFSNTFGDNMLGAHHTRVLAYDLAGTSYVASAASFRIGNYSSNTNSAGGVAADCDGTLWATGDALHLVPGVNVYGVQHIRSAGNGPDATAITNSHVIDYDDNLTQNDKYQIGDVETIPNPCSCIREIKSEMVCKGGGQKWVLTFENTGEYPIGYIAVDNVTAGATGPTTLIPVNPVLPIGGKKTIELDFTIPSTATDGYEFCFDLIVHKPDLSTCCPTKFCVQPDLCMCVGRETFPSWKSNGSGQYCITFTNLSNVTVHSVKFGSLNTTDTCPYFPTKSVTLPSPLLHGQSTTVCVPIIAPLGCGALNFVVSLHGSNGAQCCSKTMNHPWGIIRDVAVISNASDLTAINFDPGLENISDDIRSQIARVVLMVNGQETNETVNPPWGSLNPPIKLPLGTNRLQTRVIMKNGVEYSGLEKTVRVTVSGVTPVTPVTAPLSMETYTSSEPNSIMMLWDDPQAILQTTTDLKQSWTPVTGTQSPYLHHNTSDGTRYFRLRRP